MMIDDILRDPLGMPKPEKGLPFGDAQVINISNVVEYIYEGNEQEEWSMIDDVPNFAPPFNNMWFEWKEPKFANKNGVIQKMPFYSDKIKKGMHCTSRWDDKLESWMMTCSLFLQVQGNNKVVPFGSVLINITKDGKVNDRQMPHSFSGGTLICDIFDRDALTSALQLNVTFVGVAISFMHCKNVVIIKNEHPEKIQQSRARNGWKPLVRYHTLEINPMKRILKQEGQVGRNGLKKALHICRGHFKDYSEKGLFGKHKGLYWWDMHTRGSVNEGVVLKDYKVLTS